MLAGIVYMNNTPLHHLLFKAKITRSFVYMHRALVTFGVCRLLCLNHRKLLNVVRFVMVFEGALTCSYCLMQMNGTRDCLHSNAGAASLSLFHSSWVSGSLCWANHVLESPISACSTQAYIV